MRAALLAFVLVGLAGCAEPGTLCRTGTPAEGETGVCFVSEHWVVRGGHRGEAGPVVLLVHGANEDRTGFEPLARALDEAGFRPFSFDLRAHGETTKGGSRPDPRSFSSVDWNAMLDDLRAAAAWSEEHLGERPAVLVGSDVGSSLALLHGVETNASGLVLLSPGPHYKGVLVEDVQPAYRGEVFVGASAKDAASSETAERMRTRMTGAERVVGSTIPGDAHGVRLLEDERLVDGVVRFVGEAAS